MISLADVPWDQLTAGDTVRIFWRRTPYRGKVMVDGLHIRGAHPSYAFTDSTGARKPYVQFGACVWIERGHHVVVANNEISDCSQGIFTRSVDGEKGDDFEVTRDVRIAGNHLHGHGIANSEKEHATYIQSVGVTYEFNRYGPMRTGAKGNALKDRSVGAVIRYNRIEDGARAMDLVEAEDYPIIAKADPAYRSTFVYGNQITKDGRKGSTIHYGGDHAGSEANYRKGTLYFFHNSVRLTGGDYAVLFQISTNEETVEAWNNVFVFDADIPYPRLRDKQDNAPGIPSGGMLNLGRNWIDSRWTDAGPWHTVGGKLTVVEPQVTGSGSPVELAHFTPLAGSAVIDAARRLPPAVSGHPVLFQFDAAGGPKARSVRGAAADMGAVER